MINVDVQTTNRKEIRGVNFMKHTNGSDNLQMTDMKAVMSVFVRTVIQTVQYRTLLILVS